MENETSKEILRISVAAITIIIAVMIIKQFSYNIALLLAIIGTLAVVYYVYTIRRAMRKHRNERIKALEERR